MINKKLNTYLKFLREIVSTENLTVDSEFGTRYEIRYNQDKNNIISDIYVGDKKIELSIRVNGITESKIILDNKYKAMLNLNLLLLFRKIKLIKKIKDKEELKIKKKFKLREYDKLIDYIPNNKTRLLKIKKLMK